MHFMIAATGLGDGPLLAMVEFSWVKQQHCRQCYVVLVAAATETLRSPHPAEGGTRHGPLLEVSARGDNHFVGTKCW
jgi:hypothetical protein